jgi:hypothetical protein
MSKLRASNCITHARLLSDVIWITLSWGSQLAALLRSFVHSMGNLLAQHLDDLEREANTTGLR